MWQFIRRRAGYGAIALLGVVVVSFFLSKLTGDPSTLYLDDDATPAMREQFDKIHGLDGPLWSQFVTFLKGVFRFDFGESIWQQRPAMQAVLGAYPTTLLLAAIAMFVVLVLSISLGSLAAVYGFRWVDTLITFFSLACASIPDFWFALVAVLVVAVHLGLLPTSGGGSASAWVLPVITIALHPLGSLIQVVRGSMMESLSSGYITACRARGLPWRTRVLKHGLRNAALPIITVAGDRAASLVNGVLIVSTVFAFPGIGGLLVGAVLNRDFAVIQAGVFVTGAGIVLLNLVVDLIYALADPRIRVA